MGLSVPEGGLAVGGGYGKAGGSLGLGSGFGHALLNESLRFAETRHGPHFQAGPVLEE